MTSPKKKFGIDFDDVLIDFVAHMTEYHNNTYNTSFTRENYTTRNLHDTWKTSEEEAINRVKDFVISESHKGIPPMEGATGVLNRLSKKYELIIITARDKAEIDAVQYLIEKHFGNIFSSVHFLYDNGVKEKTKGQLCKDLEIDFFIDDSITNVQNTSEAGITTFLFDAPWNRDFSDSNITRVHSWKEIEEILLR